MAREMLFNQRGSVLLASSLPALVACLFLAIAPFATAEENGASEDAPDGLAAETSEPEVAQRVSVNEVAADEAIQSRLSQILQATQWFTDVRVEVRESVVFLDGTALDDERKQWAGRLVRNTEGVAAVVNRIEVKREVSLSEPLTAVGSSIKTLWDGFLIQSPLIVAGLLMLIVTALVNKLAHWLFSRVAKRSRLRGSLQDLLLQLLTIGIWICGLMIAAIIVFPGLTPAKALTVLGLSSIAIGFAFKDIFENFFAGILILWKYPFDKGDFIECGDIHGRIEDITIRMSMIRQVDGQLVVVPNAVLFKNPVDVLTSRATRRTTVICGVAYGTDLDEARDVIQRAVKDCSTVNQDKPIQIFAQEFADSSINFEVTWWTGSTPVEIRQSRDEVVRVVKRALDGAGIEIPFPQRTLWFPEPVRTLAEREPAVESARKDSDD